MLMLNLLTALLAVVIASPSPSASPAERELPTIVTVISSPYCNSLADHFNGAMLPMLANDRVLDGTSVQLDTLNTVFHQTNYVQQYLHVRDSIERQETTLNNSLAGISKNIGQLQERRRAHNRPEGKVGGRPGRVGLTNRLRPPAPTRHRPNALISGNAQLQHRARQSGDGRLYEREMTEAPAMRDSKSWLHFDNQRAVIDRSEDQAVDIAYTAAQNYCVPKK